MSWFKKAALALCLSLAACGFTPMYQGGNVTAQYKDIEIASIPNRDGQFLRNLLIDRLYTDGRPQDAKYTLNVAPIETVYTDLGIQKDATVTRTQIEVFAHVTLTDKATNAVLFDRKLRAVGGYDVLDEQYATLVTRRNAVDRVIEELSNSITAEIDLHFKRSAP